MVCSVTTLFCKVFYKTGDQRLVDIHVTIDVRWVRNGVSVRGTPFVMERDRGFETGKTISWT
jgi:hypothetical protein